MRGEACLVTSQHPYIYVSPPERTFSKKYRCIDSILALRYNRFKRDRTPLQRRNRYGRLCRVAEYYMEV